MSLELSVSTSSLSTSPAASPRVVAAVPKNCEGVVIDEDKVHYRGLSYLFNSVIEDPDACSPEDLYQRTFADLVTVAAEARRGALLLVVGSLAVGKKLLDQVSTHAFEQSRGTGVSFEVYETTRDGATAGQLLESTDCESPEDLLACVSLGHSLISSPYNDLCSVLKLRGASVTVINSSCNSLGSFIFPSFIRTIPSITHTCLILCLPSVVSNHESLERDLRRALALVGRRPVDAEQQLEDLITAWEAKYGMGEVEETSRVSRLQAVERKLRDDIDRITEECDRHRRRVSVLSDRLSEVAQFGVLTGGKDKDEATREELAESRRARKELMTKLEELEGVKTEIEADRDRLAVEAGAQSRASEKMKAEVLKWRRSLEALQQQVTTDAEVRRAETSKLSAELQRWKEKSAKADSALEESERARVEAQGQVELVKADLSSTRGRVTDLEGQLSKQSRSFQETVVDIRREHELIRTELETETQRLRRELDERNADMLEAAQKATQLKGTIEALQEENAHVVDDNNRYRLRVEGLTRRVAELTQLWQESREEQAQQLTAALRLADEKSHELEVVTAEVIALRSEKNSLVEELSRLHHSSSSAAAQESGWMSQAEIALAGTDLIPVTSLSWRSQDITRELEEAHNQMKAEIVQLTVALAAAERAAVEAQEQQALSSRLPSGFQRELLDRRNNWCQTEIAGSKLRLPEPSKSFDDFVSQQVVAAASCLEQQLLSKVRLLETAVECSRMSSEDFRGRALRDRMSRMDSQDALEKATADAVDLRRKMERSIRELTVAEDKNQELQREVLALKERLKTTEELHREELANLTEHDSKALRDIIASREGRMLQMKTSRLEAAAHAAALRERDTVVGALREERDRLQEEIRDHRSDNLSLTARLEDLGRSLYQSENENAEKMSQQIAGYEEVIAALRARCDELQRRPSECPSDSNSSLQKKVDSLQNQLASLREELLESSRLLAEQVSRSTLQADGYEGVIAGLRSRCQELEDAVTRSELAHSEELRALNEAKCEAVGCLEAKLAETQGLLSEAMHKMEQVSPIDDQRRRQAQTQTWVDSSSPENHHEEMVAEIPIMPAEESVVAVQSQRAELLSMALEDMKCRAIVDNSLSVEASKSALEELSRLREELVDAKDELKSAQMLAAQQGRENSRLQELMAARDQLSIERISLLREDFCAREGHLKNGMQRVLAELASSLEVPVDKGFSSSVVDSVALGGALKRAIEALQEKQSFSEGRQEDLQRQLERANLALGQARSSASGLLEEFRAIMGAMSLPAGTRSTPDLPGSVADEVRRLLAVASESRLREEELKRNCARLQGEIDEYISQLRSQQEENEALRRELRLAEDARNELETGMARLSDEIHTSNGVARSARAELECRQAEVEQLTADNKSLLEEARRTRESTSTCAEEFERRSREEAAMVFDDAIARLQVVEDRHASKITEVYRSCEERGLMLLEDIHAVRNLAELRARAAEEAAEWMGTLLEASREHSEALAGELHEVRVEVEDLREELERTQELMVVEEGRHRVEVQSLRTRLVDSGEDWTTREGLSMRLGDAESLLAAAEGSRTGFARLLTAFEQLTARWVESLEGFEQVSMRCADYESRQGPNSFALATSGSLRKYATAPREMDAISELISSSRKEVSRFCKTTREGLGRFSERSQETLHSLERATMSNEDLMSRGPRRASTECPAKICEEHL
ncbi:hypothetical protein FOZ61_006814 [Perkinsus olseni]|uniref:Uncharacterized protein n=1 Tax=Perkinsus olseni TaxID=32597 RepID=A0A7J6MWQ7_PEROL|nr:hypothetical protein FOZ61_006814 [Perkinsus olseni]KAF4676058.1 hypothetical protein FOL46_007936 [Perkinsus olseni]